jgi:ATP-dependent helicase IRC3
MDSTIGTYQTLNNPERLKKLDPSRYKLAIVDEAHHAAAIS